MIKIFDLNNFVSINVQTYEKEFFYLKSFSFLIKPQRVLRILARLAAPETLMQMLTFKDRATGAIYAKEYNN